MLNNVDQFPIHVLPRQVYEAVIEAHELTKAPLPLIASSAISAMSFAAQHKACVVRPNGLISPLHLYSLAIAESGERKTTADNLFFGHLWPWLTSLEEAHARRQIQYEAAFEAWKAVQKGLLLDIKKSAQEGYNSAELTVRLEAHRSMRPKAPSAPKFVYRDVTIEALLNGLQDWPSAVISANEAGMVFNGRTFNALETFNALWDGSTASLHRKNATPVQVSGASLTVSLMAQPQVVKDFLGNKGSSARGNGFLARCLICFPTSTQGTRFEQSLLARQTPNLDAFREQMRELLGSAIDADGRLTNEAETLYFSTAAQAVCLDFGNWVEGQLGFCGYYSDIRDAASKIVENMARIAAVMQRFTGQSCLIQVDTVNSAIAIAGWYLNQFKNLFGNNMAMSQEEMELQILADWFRKRANQYGQYEIPKSIVLRYGPNHLRSKAALDPVLMNLVARNLVAIVDRNKAKVIMTLPAMFSACPMGYINRNV